MSRTSNAFIRGATPLEEMIHDVAAFRLLKEDEPKCPSDPKPLGKGRIEPVVRLSYHGFYSALPGQF